MVAYNDRKRAVPVLSALILLLVFYFIYTCASAALWSTRLDDFVYYHGIVGGHCPRYKPVITPKRRLEPGTTDCVYLNFSKVALPLTALASVKGSGNTWTRHLIQQITGIYTGSIYIDDVLFSHGFPGEHVHNSSVVVIKTHESLTQRNNIFARVILLVRNPYETFIAEYHRQKGGHVGFSPEERFQSGEWESFVRYRLKEWWYFHSRWMSDGGCMLVITYRDLREHPIKTLLDIAQFLGITLKSDHIDCITNNSEGNFHRPQKSYLVGLYSKEMNKTIDAAIKNITILAKDRFGVSLHL